MGLLGIICIKGRSGRLPLIKTSADEVIAELTQWGADIVEIEAALEAADEKWNLQKNATGGNLRFMDWKCLRWETPIPDAKSLMMELLQQA